MGKSFNDSFDDFLTEHIGEDISRLREKNEKYSAALAEYSELVKKAEDGVGTDCQRDIARLVELITYIRDVEYRYLYYAGMAASRKIEDAIAVVTFKA